MRPRKIVNFEVTTVHDQAGVEQVAIVAQDIYGRLWLRIGLTGPWQEIED
jgi:hypothetical protein